MTLVILAVNIIPLLIMGFGIFYLDKYKQNLIEAAYAHMEEKAQIMALLATENEDYFERIRQEWLTEQTLLLLDKEGQIQKSTGAFWQSEVQEESTSQVRNFTETFASLFIYLNPLRTSLPPFPTFQSQEPLTKLPEVQSAIEGNIALAAWSFQNSFVLTATAPVTENGSSKGAVMIIMRGDHIAMAIDEVRSDIIQAFIIVIILTFILSVYLSSFIAIPLKKLGRAAEDIRRGKRNLTDLPDMSQRKDEIGELSTILRQMTVALDTRIDAIQNFAADVSHEIKNPITSIRSAIETALVVEDKQQREGLLKIMEQDVHRLDRLISDISRHSRLDSELARDNYQVIDLKLLLNEIADMWRNPIERQGLGEDAHKQGYNIIQVSLPEEDCFILGKGDSLGQVFQNLISNALSFHSENSPILLSAFLENDKILVCIEDRGPGIPESQLNKIFERFYSDRPANHDVAKNSGLGLSIAKQIVESHEGKISAENITEGDQIIGARFTVTLNQYNA